jgi:hypothetical protein
VPEEQFRRQAARESLVLVQPRDVCWYREPDGESSRNPTRVRFQLLHTGYDLPLTDPARRRLLAMQPPGSHSAEDLYIPQDRKLLLTISLSEPFSGFCYKLVAGVVVLPQAWDPFF